MHRRMRVFFSICVGMVHPVHDRIRLRAYKRSSLCYIAEDKKETLPEGAQFKASVRSVPVQKKGLTKKT